MLSKLRLPIRTPVLIISVLTLVLIGTLGSVSASSASTQQVSQGYIAGSAIQTGMIVRIDSNDPNKVVPLDLKNINKMFGVVVSANSSALTLAQIGNGTQVYVTNYGQHSVLVTNQDGPIAPGDYITISSVSGLGMKANSSQSIVLGQAAGSFNGVNNIQGTVNLTAGNGQKTTVAIGSIPVDISIANNPLAQGPQGLPSALSKIVKFATDKSVSASRVYLSLLILLAGIAITVTIIYSGVKNGLISLGRNPLAKRVIGGSLLRLVIAGIIIFAISLGAAYAVLL
jgi:hypothetical protein